MRVIAGRLRGRLLSAPVGRTTRPITDRVKETLFNILGSRYAVPGELPAVDVLDLFAGSGGLGIEALSRGAARCTFVERDKAALAALRANINALGLGACARVVVDDAWRLRLLPDVRRWGLIFADPPFPDTTTTARVVDLLTRLVDGLAEGGVLVLRHETSTLRDLADIPIPALPLADRRDIGRMALTMFARS